MTRELTGRGEQHTASDVRLKPEQMSARRAGAGSAIMHRHFAGRTKLLGAAPQDQIPKGVMTATDVSGAGARYAPTVAGYVSDTAAPDCIRRWRRIFVRHLIDPGTVCQRRRILAIRWGFG